MFKLLKSKFLKPSKITSIPYRQLCVSASNRRFLNKLDLTELMNTDLPLANVLKEEILSKGPMSFAHYMDRCLIHEKYGYYMKKDVFNTKGDFITSPEISQMFGEMIGVWITNFLSTIKVIDLDNQKPKEKNRKFSLIEFGPGRGTLTVDILRTLHQFKLLKGVEVNFIEASPFMRKLQQENILKLLQKYDIWMKFEYDENRRSKVEEFTNEDKDNFLRLRWFGMYEQYLYEEFGEYTLKNLKKDTPSAPVIVIAHEFFDALPVHLFEYTSQYGWCEKLVTICHDARKNKKFEFTLSAGENENVKKILKPNQTFTPEMKKSLKDGDTIEVSPKSLLIMNSISELIQKVNGASLIIDYGEDQALSYSIRGIRSHKYVEDNMLLEFPGEVDLSAYVNFSALADVATKTPDIISYGPMPQGLFLESMGINARLDILCQKSNPAVAKRLESEYIRLVHPDEMGQIYKVLYVGKKENGEIFPFLDEGPKVFY